MHQLRYDELERTEGESMMLAFIRNIGGPEVLIVLAVVLLIFGAAKLPQLARSLGASAKEFRKGVEEGAEDMEPSAADDTSD
jgi:sec-independent protein translocase protein TatA